MKKASKWHIDDKEKLRTRRLKNRLYPKRDKLQLPWTQKQRVESKAPHFTIIFIKYLFTNNKMPQKKKS